MKWPDPPDGRGLGQTFGGDGRALSDSGGYRGTGDGVSLAIVLGQAVAGALTLDEMQTRSVIFLQRAGRAMRSDGTIPPPNGKVIAHEVGRLAFGPFHAVTDAVNLRAGGQTNESDLLRKRLDPSQATSEHRVLRRR